MKTVLSIVGIGICVALIVVAREQPVSKSVYTNHIYQLIPGKKLLNDNQEHYYKLNPNQI